MADLISTLTELDEWARETGKTMQLTYRTRLHPAWLCRILLPTEMQPGDGTGLYAQGVGDNPSEAIERALEAWLTGIEDAEYSGRRRKHDD